MSADVSDTWDWMLNVVALIGWTATVLGFLFDHPLLWLVGIATAMVANLVLAVRQGLRRRDRSNRKA
jgi:hypothetical protein